MIRLFVIPFILAAIGAWVMSRISLWKTRQELTQNSSPLTQGEILVQARQLAKALDLEQISVLVYEQEAVNGLADHDGRIFLTRGFLREFQSGRVSAEEIASVIAHELGHVAHGHMSQRMRDVVGHQTVLMMANMVLARAIPFIGPLIFSKLAGAWMARRSRSDEFEADAWASALLIKSGIGTAPQKSLFRKLDRLTNAPADMPSSLADWLRSHPKTAERIAAIEANEARWRVGS